MDAELIFNKYLRQAVRGAANEVAEEARTKHGFTSRTGNLERAIKYVLSSDGMKAWVTIDRTMAPYGPYVHRGHKAFTLVPRHKKALRWVEGNEFVYAKRVQIPEYKGDPFLFDALDSKKDEVFKIFENRVDAALEEIAKGL